MARIRSTKPEFWTDPLMCTLPRDVRFTFKGIWEVMADDAGRFRADPLLVKAQVWPLEKDISAKKVAKFLRILAERRRIILYDVEGAPYGFVVNWLRHQRIDHPSSSIIPAPPDSLAPTPRELLASDSRATRESLAPERNGAEGIGNGMERGADGALADSAVTSAARALSPSGQRPLSIAETGLPEQTARFVEVFYGRSPPERRQDVDRQLRAAIAPEGPGAQVRAGVFVRARTPEHLNAVCAAVIANPPRKSDAAIWFVLSKLADSAAATASTRSVPTRDERELQLEETYFAAAQEARGQWARENPEAFERICRSIDEAFQHAGSGAFYSMARESALTCEFIRAGGFLPFDAWVRNRPPNSN